jgi:hypothetical protein
MSTLATLQRAAQTAREAFGDVFRPVTYAVVSSPEYDPVSGLVGYGVVPMFFFRALFARFSHYHRVALGIPVDDMKMIFALLDAPGLEPRAGHLVQTETGTVWEVVAVMHDPAQALGILQVRRSRKLFP